MPQVFVDVDDTLVIFKDAGPNPYGVIDNKPFKPNEKLIEKLLKFEGNIVIWSGGGIFYAKEVANKVLPKQIRFSVQDKFFDSKTFQPGDIIIDDQPFYFLPLKEIGCSVFNPFEDWRQ